MIRFYDPEGICQIADRFTRDGYEYPIKIPRIPKYMRFNQTSNEIPAPEVIRFEFRMVYCGPDAPFPSLPTADEFREGLALWLSPVAQFGVEF